MQVLNTTIYKLLRCGALVLLLNGVLIVQAVADAPPVQGPWILEDDVDESPYNLSGVQKDATTSSKRRRFTILRKFSRDFKDLCAAIERDGRKEFLYNIAKPRSSKGNTCSHCRAFYKLLQKNCRPPRKKRRRKKDEAVEEQHPPKQRIPHPEVIEVAGRLFRGVIEDAEEERDLVIDVYKNFISVLKDPNANRTTGQREYAGYFVVMLEDPIAPYEKIREQKRLQAERKRWELQSGTSTFKLEPSMLDKVFGTEE